MTWGVVSSCRQATWPFSCDYHNFGASNVQCPRTAELGIMSCKWNYSVNHRRARGLSWWERIIARLCLSRICSLKLSTVRHSRDKCYVTALLCGSSSYPFARRYLIIKQANIPYYHHLPLHLQGCISNADNQGFFHYPELHVSVNSGESTLSGSDWIRTSAKGTVSLKSFVEHPNGSITNYMSLGTWDRRQVIWKH